MTYQMLKDEILSLKDYENVDFFVIGKSTLGEDIYGMHIGSFENKQIFINGSIHSREYLSSFLCVELCKMYSKKDFVGGMYFVPLINPDGVRISLEGVGFLDCEKQQNFLIDVNGGSKDFSLYKADALAVDLNVNFDALWGSGSQNVFCPAIESFVGYYPNSEREVRVMQDFFDRNKPCITICFHTKGEVIYWGFEVLTQTEIERDKKVVDAIADSNGYTPIRTINSAGGYSDWIALTSRKTAMTIELGNGNIEHPLSVDNLEKVVLQNKNVPAVALEMAFELDL